MVKGFLSTLSFSPEKKSVPPEAKEDKFYIIANIGNC
jgi:hypothetical protein